MYSYHYYLQQIHFYRNKILKNLFIFLKNKLNNHEHEVHYKLNILNHKLNKQYLMNLYHHNILLQDINIFHFYLIFFLFVIDYYHKLNIDLIVYMSYNHSYKAYKYFEFDQDNVFLRKHSHQY